MLLDLRPPETSKTTIVIVQGKMFEKKNKKSNAGCKKKNYDVK